MVQFEQVRLSLGWLNEKQIIFPIGNVFTKEDQGALAILPLKGESLESLGASTIWKRSDTQQKVKLKNGVEF